jgi:sugar lactone lactonase YvrE
MRRQIASVACYCGDVLGESPVWDAQHGVLYWVDIRRSVLHKLTTTAGRLVEQRFEFGPELLTGVVVARDDALLLGLKRGMTSICLQLLDASSVAVPCIDADFLPTQNRLNEIKTDPRGRIWCGAMWDYARGRSGGLYRVDADGRLACVRDDVTVPNSLAFSPDGKWIYFADSAAGAIERASFDAESGSVGEWHELVSAAQAPGKPDGLAIDADGCLWSARFGAGCVIRFTPEGKHDVCIDLPTSQPTSCAFGGPGLSTLFITSATQRLSAEDRAREQQAGSLFAVETATTGLPVTHAVVPGVQPASPTQPSPA